jgi:hypothetical protein
VANFLASLLTFEGISHCPEFPIGTGGDLAPEASEFGMRDYDDILWHITSSTFILPPVIFRPSRAQRITDAYDPAPVVFVLGLVFDLFGFSTGHGMRGHLLCSRMNVNVVDPILLQLSLTLLVQNEHIDKQSFSGNL